MANYDAMTDDEFHAILGRLVGKMSASEILAMGDVRSTLAEELNNEVLDAWAEEHPVQAYGFKFVPGCYGDGANGHDHVRAMLEVTLNEAAGQWCDASGNEPPDFSFYGWHDGYTVEDCTADLALEMSDDAAEEDAALAWLNEYAPLEGHWWGFVDGSFGLWEDDE